MTFKLMFYYVDVDLLAYYIQFVNNNLNFKCSNDSNRFATCFYAF
jgi:hypothetical protein